ASIREQNVQVAAGQVGQYPAPSVQGFQFNVTTLGRLSNPEQFADIIVKADDSRVSQGDAYSSQFGSGSAARLTRVRDIARVERGSQVYDQYCQIGGQPAATLAVFQLPGANALDVARKVKAVMQRIKPSFPDGLDYVIPFDTTIFVEESIHEVYKTLIEAGL